MEELILNEREFKRTLVKIMNESKLPAFIVKTVLREALTQIEQLEEIQYQNAIKNKNNKKEGE